MTLRDPDPIDATLHGVQAGILRDRDLSAQLEASWDEFCPGRPRPARAGPSDGSRAARGSEDELAARRHLEWFLLERVHPGPAETRIEALVERAARAAGAPPADVRRSLEASHAGVFEVLRVDPGESVLLRDLAARSEHTAHEAHGSQLLQPGDLIAGRIFPIGGSLCLISRAAAVWRDPRLLAALTADLDRARADRPAHLRGSLRLRQSEIEAMFHPGSTAPPPPGAVAEARRLLLAGGVSPESVQRILSRLAERAPDRSSLVLGMDDALGESLEELAFETSIDLEAARRVLLPAWEELHGAPSAIEAEPAPRAGANGEVAAAVAEFDRKRREGAPLEQVFRDLERDLGIAEVGEDEEEDTPVPDFPGVVAAMVEEFLWDEGRERGSESAARYAGLRSLGRFAYAADIGVFENLSAAELTRYACRWLIENRELGDAEAARALLEGLARFCSWAQENHEVRLEDGFAPVLKSLEESLPRLVEANRSLAADPAQAGDWYVAAPGDGGVVAARLSEPRGPKLPIDPRVARFLRPGDLVRGTQRGTGELAISGGFPAEAARLELA